MTANTSLRELRRTNLSLILASLGGHGGQKKLSEKTGIHNSYISNLRVGNREMGEEIARKIETAMGLAVGWMDQPHSGIEDDQVTFANTATFEEVALEQRLLALWDQLPVQRQQIALEVLEDMVVSTKVRLSPHGPTPDPNR